MSEVAFGISRELYSFSQHCSCCCCRYRLSVGTNQATTTRKSVANSSSAAPTTTGSRKSGADRLKRLEANGRERDRVHVLNSALARLRDALPSGSGLARSRSKIATLRGAQNYIRALSSVLAELESTKSGKDETDPRACSTASSWYGETTQRQQKASSGGVFRQPEVTSGDVSGRSTAISRQMSLESQHEELPFSTVVSYTLQRKSFSAVGLITVESN